MDNQIRCAKSELCIFEPTAVQIVMESSLWCDIHPKASLNKNSNIEYDISGDTSDYLDLNDTILSLTRKITTHDGNAPSGGNYAGLCITNHLLHALFKDVKVYLNDVQIEGGNNLYPFKAAIQNELNFSKESKNIQLTPSGHATDRTRLRDKYYVGGGSFQLTGAMMIDFFQNHSKYLLPGVNVKVLLERSKNQFTLQVPESANTDEVRPKIVIEDAVLYIRKVCTSRFLLRSNVHIYMFLFFLCILGTMRSAGTHWS